MTHRPPASADRRGFTILELLLASMVTALVAASASTFLSATTNASLTTRDVRSTQNAGHFALTQITKAIREARAIGEVTTTSVTLWVNDANKDDKLNLYETAIIHYDAAGKQLLYEYPKSSGATPTTVVTTTNFKSATTLGGLMPSGDKKVVVWATDITSMGFSGNPGGTDARMVETNFTIDLTGQPVAFRGAANARASADYLFYDATQTTPIGSPRKQRKEISRWEGYTPIVGQSATPKNLN
ncbi:MAG TPA: prepilin-type N-terminal cleavage/methylation domain-containing protein [Phycisphaerae bacterium]|nr:prepilin-type N-terminal cleavage/methylation domain-containing protein [Phycisphaerae bacterium]